MTVLRNIFFMAQFCSRQLYIRDLPVRKFYCMINNKGWVCLCSMGPLPVMLPTLNKRQGVNKKDFIGI